MQRAREFHAPFVFCVGGIEVTMDESRKLRCAVPENQFFERIYALVSPNIRTWQAIGAVIALVGSIVAAGLGTVSAVLGWFLAGQRFGSLLDKVGTILFFLTIPLLVFAAHCLDLLEKKSKSSSISVAGAEERAEVGLNIAGNIPPDAQGAGGQFDLELPVNERLGSQTDRFTGC